MKNEKYIMKNARRDRARIRRAYGKLRHGEKRLFALVESLFEIADLLPICEYEYRDLIDFSCFMPFYEIEEKFFDALKGHGVLLDSGRGAREKDPALGKERQH